MFNFIDGRKINAILFGVVLSKQINKPLIHFLKPQKFRGDGPLVDPVCSVERTKSMAYKKI